MRGRVHQKKIYRGECLKRETWTVFRVKGDLARYWGRGIFEEEVDTPMHIMIEQEFMKQ